MSVVPEESSRKVWGKKERRHRRGKRSLMRSLLAGIDLHCLPAPNLSVSLVFHRAECVVFETVWISRNTSFPLSVWNSEEDYSLHRHDEGLSRPVPIYLSFLPGRKAILHRSLTPLMLLLFETAIPEGLHKKKKDVLFFGSPQLIIPDSNMPRPNLATSYLSRISHKILSAHFYTGINGGKKQIACSPKTLQRRLMRSCDCISKKVEEQMIWTSEPKSEYFPLK